jgi:hypothetical protein
MMPPKVLQHARAQETSLLGPERVTARGHDDRKVTGGGSKATAQSRARDGDEMGRHVSSSPLGLA